jgi:wyosine [tRNA(Phe)-imidazoG37] synthetase (radical SAM superfamily)
VKLKRKVNFDICTYCNHKCVFCSNPDPRTIKDQTSLADFKKVMRNLTKNVEVSELGLSARGEALINKGFAQIIESCKQEFHMSYVYFSTNGALLTNKKSIELLDAGVDSIKFSVNALDAETYNSVHQVNDFDLSIENFKNLLLLKKSKYRNLKITISSVIDLDEDLLKDEFEKILGDDYGLIDGISVNAIVYTSKFDEVSARKVITKKCPIPFEVVSINSDGSLGLCCRDYFGEINFGSLKENDFMDLYNSKEFTEIRKMHDKSKFPDNHLCKRCLLYSGE